MSLKKYFQRHSRLLDLRAAAGRYLINAIGFVEILVLPFLLAPADYAEIERNKQLVAFSPVVLLGAGLGYLKFHFKGVSNINSGSYTFGALISSFVVSAVLLIFGANSFQVSAVFLYIFTSAIEKQLLGCNRLLIAYSYKAFISVALIVGTLIFTYFASEELNAGLLYPIAIIVALSIWISFAIKSVSFQCIANIEGLWVCVCEYVRLIKSGFVLNLLTFVIILHFIFERMVIADYFSEQLPSYSLAYAFSQIGIVMINAIAYAFQNKFGIASNQLQPNEYRAYRNAMIFVYVALLVFSIPMIYIYQGYYGGYDDLLEIYISFYLFSGLYFSISSTSVIALYLGLSNVALISFLVFLFVNVFFSPFVGFDYSSIFLYLFKSGILIVCAAFYLDYVIIKRLDSRL